MAKSPIDGRRNRLAAGRVRGMVVAMVAAGLATVSAAALAESKHPVLDASASDVQASEGSLNAAADKLYPAADQFCGSDGKALLGDGLGLFNVGGTLALLPVPEGYASNAKNAAACGAKATQANLNIQFPGQNAVLLAGPVGYEFTPAQRVVDAAVIEPTLCHSYYLGADKLALDLTDSNKQEKRLLGISSLDYTLSNARFAPTVAQGTHGPAVQCYTFAFDALRANPPVIPAAPANVSIFNANFEESADLRVDFTNTSPQPMLIGKLDTLAATPFTYRIVVSNLGEAPAAGVRVEEFVPLSGVPSPILSPTVSAGVWTCTKAGAASCGITGVPTNTGSGVLSVGGLDVAPGDIYTFELTRTVPAGAVGVRTVVGAAAFYDPSHATGRGDIKAANNSAPLVIELVSNQPPVIACVNDADGVTAIASPIAMSEDAAARSYTCSVSDPENDPIAGFVVAGNTNPALFPSAALLTPLGNDEWNLTLAPTADLHGSVNLTLRARDDRGGIKDLGLVVNVASVNDAPSFDLVSNTAVLFANGDAVRDAGNNVIEDQVNGIVQNFGNNCFDASTVCSVSIDKFVQNVDAGPPSESSETVTPLTSICVRTDAAGSPSDLFSAQPTSLPAGASASGSNFALSWTFKKGAPTDVVVECTIRFQDNGTPAATSESTAAAKVTFSLGAP